MEEGGQRKATVQVIPDGLADHATRRLLDQLARRHSGRAALALHHDDLGRFVHGEDSRPNAGHPDKKQFDEWLDPEVHEAEQIVAMMKPCPATWRASTEVSTLVNSTKNNRAELLEPISK
jgi:hypothetical protein